jgi:hypothetical protein
MAVFPSFRALPLNATVFIPHLQKYKDLFFYEFKQSSERKAIKGLRDLSDNLKDNTVIGKRLRQRICQTLTMQDRYERAEGKEISMNQTKDALTWERKRSKIPVSALETTKDTGNGGIW